MASPPNQLHSLTSYKDLLTDKLEYILPQNLTEKHYTLIVSVSTTKSQILLGLKRRGFGKGRYNSFGGKVDHGEDITHCAVRELKEESNIDCSYEYMLDSYVGVLYFTFQDKEQSMVVHLFSINLDVITPADSTLDVIGCEEITPKWFDLCEIPYHNMFADDTIWLPMVVDHLTTKKPIVEGGGLVPCFNQYFHYKPGGDKVNEIDFYFIEELDRSGDSYGGGNERRLAKASYRAKLGNLGLNPIHLLTVGLYIELGFSEEGDDNLRGDNDNAFFDSSTDIIALSPGSNSRKDAKNDDRNIPQAKKLCANPKKIDRTLNPKPLTLENKLFHAIHKDCSLSVKEFKESFAFANSVLSTIGKKSISSVIDVAGGHGALASLFLILDRNIENAVVIDPAYCESGVKSVKSAFRDFLPPGKEVAFIHERLEDVLAEEIIKYKTLCGGDGNRVCVIACHACQFLTDEILSISEKCGVNVCVMPCCQKDGTGGNIKSFAKELKLPVGAIIDVMSAGKMLRSYDVRMKLLKNASTPQNRLVICKLKTEDGEEAKKIVRNASERKLADAYLRAHKNGDGRKKAALFTWPFVVGVGLSFIGVVALGFVGGRSYERGGKQ